MYTYHLAVFRVKYIATNNMLCTIVLIIIKNLDFHKLTAVTTYMFVLQISMSVWNLTVSMAAALAVQILHV